MLHRLISNLSFSPGLVSELSFYGKKLKKEGSIRRIGFILIILGLLVQIFAASVPTQKSLTESANDIIKGGATTKQDILTAWDNPTTQVADIYRKFGLTRDDIARLSNKPNVRIKSNGSNFWTVSRNSLTAYTDQQTYLDKEISIKTNGSTVFLRPLRAWDQGKNTAVYNAYEGVSVSTGEPFWILADSGDFTQNGPGQLLPPQVEARQSIVGASNTVKPGGTVKFRIELRNNQESSLAEDVKVIDNLKLDKYDVISPSDLPVSDNGKLGKNLGNLRYTDNGIIFDLVVRVKDNLKNGVEICNSAEITSSNATVLNNGILPQACIKVTRDNTAGMTDTIPVTTTSKIAFHKQNKLDFPPSFSMAVNNTTQGLSGEATINKSTSPGDLIEYKLTTYNGNAADIKNYTIKDYVGDILDYADIDHDFLNSEDGSFNNTTKEIIWTNQTLKSKQDNTKVFRVKLKNPLPSTNQPSRTSTTFDCKLSNEYGNEISIKLQCPPIKSIETLPNTEPGSAIAIASGLVLFSGYFLARNRLISKEVFIIKRQISGSK